MIVIKHKFIAARGKGGVGKVKAMGKAIAHLRYIQHRPGPDKERGGRELFNDKDERMEGRELKRMVRDLGEAKVIAHKLTLSPEVAPEDKKAYTRDVMKNMSRDMGLDLEWVACAHSNTDHHHIHVVVLGKDRNGREVNIRLSDVDKAKEFSDGYIERWHPREFERARAEREAKELEQERTKKIEREERIREGIELPWAKKTIIREQLEPYKEWKEKREQEPKRRGRPAKEADRSSELEKIEAVEKHWSKANSLDELRALNEHLWDNVEDRIALDDYKKLASWIREKEAAERVQGAGRKSSQGEKDRQGEPDRDYVEYMGKRFSEADSFEKLQGLAAALRLPKERLPYDDYQKLRGWMEDKDRERWSGALGKQIEHDRYRHEYGKTAGDLKAAEGGRVIDPIQQSLAGNPVMKLFMFEANLARTIVGWIPLTENRDKLNDSREDLEKAKRDLAQEKSPAGNDSASKDAHERLEKRRETIDKAIEKNERAQFEREIEEKRRKEERERGREDRDSFERDSWGRF